MSGIHGSDAREPESGRGLEPRPEPPLNQGTGSGVDAAPIWMLPLLACVRPVSVVQRHLNQQWDRAAWFILMVFGIGNAAERASDRSLGDKADALFLAMLILGLGALGGAVSGLVYSALLRLVSRMFKGHASMADLRAAIAWGMMPTLFAAVVFWSLMLGMFGHSIFRSDLEVTALQGVVTLLSVALSFACAIWSVVNVSRAIGFVNGYTSWKGFATLLIAGLVPVLIAVAVVMLVVSLR